MKRYRGPNIGYKAFSLERGIWIETRKREHRLTILRLHLRHVFGPYWRKRFA